MEQIHQLPDACGVYYFHDHAGDVVYVGKSTNIKKRVASHFSKKTTKAKLLQEHVNDISFELTGSELIALLLESDEIKRLSPPINRAQRVKRFPFVVYQYKDGFGRIRMEAARNNKTIRDKYEIVSEYPKQSRAVGHLKSMIYQYELCPKMCGTEKGSGACFSYHLKKCHGVCADQEEMESYNERARMAIEKIGNENAVGLKKNNSELGYYHPLPTSYYKQQGWVIGKSERHEVFCDADAG